MSRTNVEIDDQLVRRVMQRDDLPTKRVAMSREEALETRGTGWVGALAELREGYHSSA